MYSIPTKQYEDPNNTLVYNPPKCGFDKNVWPSWLPQTKPQRTTTQLLNTTTHDESAHTADHPYLAYIYIYIQLDSEHTQKMNQWSYNKHPWFLNPPNINDHPGKWFYECGSNLGPKVHSLHSWWSHLNNSAPRPLLRHVDCHPKYVCSKWPPQVMLVRC